MSKAKEIDVRAIAFRALAEQGMPRLAVQEQLGISRTEFYRLSRKLARAEAKHAEPTK